VAGYRSYVIAVLHCDGCALRPMTNKDHSPSHPMLLRMHAKPPSHWRMTRPLAFDHSIGDQICLYKSACLSHWFLPFFSSEAGMAVRDRSNTGCACRTGVHPGCGTDLCPVWALFFGMLCVRSRIFVVAFVRSRIFGASGMLIPQCFARAVFFAKVKRLFLWKLSCIEFLDRRGFFA